MPLIPVILAIAVLLSGFGLTVLAQGPELAAPTALALPIAQELPGIERLPVVQEIGHTAGDLQKPNASAPESLEQAWANAFSADQRLKERESGIAMAEIQLDRARRDRWPTLKVDGAYALRDHAQGFTFADPSIPPGTVFNYQQQEDFSFQSRVDLPLYTSGRIGHSIDAASAGLNASSLDLEAYRRGLKLTVAELYVAVLRSQSELRVTKSRVLSLSSHLKNVKVLRENQRVPKNDLLAAQVEHSQSQQEEIHAWHQLEANRAAYNRRVGRPLDSTVKLAELSPPAASPSVKELTEKALRQRPELSSATAQIQQSQDQADGRIASGKPQVGLLGRYDFQENRYQRYEGSTSLAVGVSWDAWDAGRTRLDAAKLSSQVDRLSYRRADLQTQIALDVRRAWLNMRETRHRIEVARGAVGRAEENLRVASVRYRAGTEIGSVVLDAQSLLARTRSNHTNAVYDSVVAELRLLYATGDL